jgi:hypothetical protein
VDFCFFFYGFRQLLEDKEVLFAGYRVPHPLRHAIEVKIQTTTNSNPQRAMNSALSDLISEFSTLEQRFKVKKNLMILHVLFCYFIIIIFSFFIFFF